MEEFKQAWEQQNWENDSSHRLFRQYYLPQKKPRSLNTAYKLYLQEEKQFKKEKLDGKIAPGSWQKWFRGHDNDNKPIKEAKTWKERAEAYDFYQEEVRQDIKIESKMELLDRELSDYQRELQIWTEMTDDLESRMNFERKIAEEKDLAFDPTKFVKPFSDIVNLREKIAVLGRRALNMPTTITEDRLANTEDKPFEIIWKEPTFDDKDIGLGAEAIEKFITRRNRLKFIKTEQDTTVQ